MHPDARRKILRLYTYLTMDNGLHLDKYRIDAARLPGHYYGQAGQYFITICTQNRYPYFGQIQPAASALQDAYLLGTALAERACACWQQIPQHFPFVETGDFVVMPDHVHGILFFHRPADRADQPTPVFGPQSDNLASVVRGFKVGVKAWATTSQIPFAWQPRYFDRVIRNDVELTKISAYIWDNPNRWETDRTNDMGLFC